MFEIAKYADGLAKSAGLSLSLCHEVRMADVVLRNEDMTTEQRVALSVACDLRHILCATPEGRQALRDLGFDPLLQNAKGE
ncbi:hypothetical protein NJI34_34600 [Pseudomonas sp. S 311-6]|nr:hypothetical protein [Pseudomonas sp. S 311-6]